MKKHYLLLLFSIYLISFNSNVFAQCIPLGQDDQAATTINSVSFNTVNYTCNSSMRYENTGMTILVDNSDIKRIPFSLSSAISNPRATVKNVYWRIWIDADGDNIVETQELIYGKNAASGGNNTMTQNLDISGLSLPINQSILARILLTDDESLIHNYCGPIDGGISLKALDTHFRIVVPEGRVNTQNNNNGKFDCGSCFHINRAEELELVLYNLHDFSVYDLEISSLSLNSEGYSTGNIMQDAEVRILKHSINGGDWTPTADVPYPIDKIISTEAVLVNISHVPEIALLTEGCEIAAIELSYKDDTEYFYSPRKKMSVLLSPESCTDLLTKRHTSFQQTEHSDNETAAVSPNPFRYETKISYSLLNKSKVKIGLYDILGRPIKSLYSGVKEKGNHNLLIDGHNLERGIYFCIIEIDEERINHKILKID